MRSITLGVIVFIVMILRQAIFSDKMNWFDTIGFSVTVVIAFIFVDWTRKPYQ